MNDLEAQFHELCDALLEVTKNYNKSEKVKMFTWIKKFSEIQIERGRRNKYWEGKRKDELS